jgi:hypothetical protein
MVIEAEKVIAIDKAIADAHFDNGNGTDTRVARFRKSVADDHFC